MKLAGRVLIVLLLAGTACRPPEAIPTPVEPAVTTITTTSTVPTTSTTADTREGDPACLSRAQFGDPSQSLYVLPFPPGARYQVTQTYCFPAGGHRNQLAYDFNMPIGAEVVAAREGTVFDIRQDSPDDGRGDGEHNFVFIQHDDGSVAFYAHLKQNGVLVELGDLVQAGEVIALSGNSGLTGRPHLHFGVYRGVPMQEGHDVPVNFRNTDYPLDGWGGLRKGGVYEAQEDPGLPDREGN